MSFEYPQQPAPTFGMQGAPQQPQQQEWQPPPPRQPSPPPQDKGDTEGMALLTVAIIFHVLLNLYWLHADNHLIHLDEAHHINCAAAYYDALFPEERAGLFERGVAALAVESPYPPLTHLVGAGFIRLFGYSPDVVAFSGSLFLGLFLVGVYLFARQGMMGRNAFLAAFVAGFMPIIFGGARYFMPDLLLAALTTWALFALLKSDRFRKTGWVTLFAFFTGLAFLTKQTALVYLLLPFLCILGWGVCSAAYPAKAANLAPRRARAAQILFNLLLCGCIVLGVCSWWYTRHVEYMYTWWSTQRGGETGLLQPGIASRIEFAMPETLEDAASRIYLDPAISRLNGPSSEPAPASDTPSLESQETPPENTFDQTKKAEAPKDAQASEEPEDLEDSESALFAPLEVETPAPPDAALPEDAPREKPEESAAVSHGSDNDASLETESEAANNASAPHVLDAPPQPRQAHADILEPFRSEWAVYPLLFLNEAAFLPICVAALFGLPALFLRRNRKTMAVLLLVWLGGAYLLLTGLFTVRSPLLLCAATPPAATLCVLALDAVPRYRLRRALWGLLMFFMALQYINLTLFSFGPLKRIEIPALSEQPAVQSQGNNGLTLYKDRVDLGHYTLHAPHRGEVVAERIFDGMAAYEACRARPAGPVAWYQVVAERPAHLSMDFYARHYARASSQTTDGIRPFAAVKWESRAPENTLPELAETEYVVLKQDADILHAARLEAWAGFFKPHGFESILNCRFDGYGKAAPGYVHVMARKDAPALDDDLDIFDLYDLLDRDGRHWLLTDEERIEAERRYALKIREYTHIQPLNKQLNLLGFHVKNIPENWHVLRFIVHVNEPVSENIRLWVRGTAHDEDREKALEIHQGQEALVWDFTPRPAPASWQRNQALVLSRPVMAAPLRYQIKIGVLGADDAGHPIETVETDWVDFAGQQ